MAAEMPIGGPKPVTVPGRALLLQPAHIVLFLLVVVIVGVGLFFGMQAGPTVARGRVNVVLHLLAPNRRAVQITSDLSGFWELTYAAVRRELRRKYPKHDWPLDGKTATPPPPGRLRAR